MTILDLDLILASAVAFGLGFAPIRSWKVAASSCALVAVVAWLARAIIIVTGRDVSVAEDYLNGLDAKIVVIEIAVSFAWIVVCYGLGSLVAWAKRRLSNVVS